jgi:hypothetical protein
MDLVLLMDRIKARCAEKRTRGAALSGPGLGGEGSVGAGEARSRYQELFDSRVQAEACLDDFHALMEGENQALKHVMREISSMIIVFPLNFPSSSSVCVCRTVRID